MVVETNRNSHRGTLFYSFEVPKDQNLLTGFKRYYGYHIYTPIFLKLQWTDRYFENENSKVQRNPHIFKQFSVSNNEISIFFTARSQDGTIHSDLVEIYQEKQMKSWIWSKVRRWFQCQLVNTNMFKLNVFVCVGSSITLTP